jgi:deazaflavin-dependent oxidoreductase (nitroreductase family)
MAEENAHPYLYLTTTGWKSGKAHQIEIWYVAHAGRYYIVSGGGERSHWVQNIRRDPAITVSIGSRDAAPFQGTARPIDRAAEPELAAQVAALMDQKYNWSDGLIVQLTPGA